MATGVGVAVSFLLLAVALCFVALVTSGTRMTTPGQSVSAPGGIAEPSADAKALIEELRLLRGDIGKLQEELRGASWNAGAAQGESEVSAPAVSGTAMALPAPVVGGAKPDDPAKRDGSLLLAVITNPAHFDERAHVRRFYQEAFPEERTKVRVVFVVGKNIYLGNPPKPLSAEKKAMMAKLTAESKEFGDIVWVDGRENLPHVGKATEKSAAWWQTAPSLGSYGHYCKSDDDSLIHISRLRRDLEAAGERTLYGYVAFRGWKPSYKFQACGIDVRPWAVEKALQGRDMGRNENCTDSVGPFPYAGGNLVCMGQVLARTLAGDSHFDGFIRKAHERNDNGMSCKNPFECASQPWETHMWHHEDAGISYNLFRSLVRNKVTGVKVVKIQPWVHIQHWLRDNITEPIPLVVIHNLKTLKLVKNVTADWRIDLGPWGPEEESFDCAACSKQWGWKWARTCASGDGDWCDALTEFDPNDFYTCCFKTYPTWVMQRMNAEEKARNEAERERRKQKEALKAAAAAAAAGLKKAPARLRRRR
mmetsp:Transcript_19907/g.58764  ORF Transcript_19907/g.58764 Transcript_19907/m.58764 type:complete len:535 (-) Transcript_19907:131-1735(-)